MPCQASCLAVVSMCLGWGRPKSVGLPFRPASQMARVVDLWPWPDGMSASAASQGQRRWRRQQQHQQQKQDNYGGINLQMGPGAVSNSRAAEEQRRWLSREPGEEGLRREERWRERGPPPDLAYHRTIQPNSMNWYQLAGRTPFIPALKALY
ncbi:unnamed protein product [Protopolystoma xenopodis]|uniref:Uncharacterized protein n=1 Tax=Protopolystoma xenopodis TaxID=117903 RepID=A0A448WPY6_9PLAT|nr:unnamed protein product [Protopolystoma xenopodis]